MKIQLFCILPWLLLCIPDGALVAQQATKVDNTSKASTKGSPAGSNQAAVLGIDVSHFQGKIDWKKIKEVGIRFVYDKATQGIHYKDPEYSENKQGAHTFGLLHGSYHFYTSDQGGKEQADHFISVVEYSPGDMPPVLDLEQAGIKGAVEVEALQKEILVWLSEVENKLEVKPIIYTNRPFGNQYLSHPSFAEYDLWIAEYGVDKPRIPQIWEEKGWLIWQRSDRGKVEGVVGEVDHDLFNPARPFEVTIE